MNSPYCSPAIALVFEPENVALKMICPSAERMPNSEKHGLNVRVPLFQVNGPDNAVLEIKVTIGRRTGRIF
jgi:hypothetical protein